MDSRGDDPGWISKHRARLEDPSTIRISKGKICTEQGYVDNEDEFLFDVRSGTWSGVKA